MQAPCFNSLRTCLWGSLSECSWAVELSVRLVSPREQIVKEAGAFLVWVAVVSTCRGPFRFLSALPSARSLWLWPYIQGSTVHACFLVSPTLIWGHSGTYQVMGEHGLCSYVLWPSDVAHSQASLSVPLAGIAVSWSNCLNAHWSTERCFLDPSCWCHAGRALDSFWLLWF